MSVATSLRSYLGAIPSMPVTQIYHGLVPADCDVDQGFIWFQRRSTDQQPVFEQTGSGPDSHTFDIEAYHPDPDVTEQIADLLHSRHCYRGAFGSGKIQGLFVGDQSDDYVQRVENTDTESLASTFLSIEIRSFKE